MIGTTLSYYRIVEQTGDGGMGVVHRAPLMSGAAPAAGAARHP